jgi:predicted N-acetyltransferase YhbS
MRIRRAVPEDAEPYGRICYEAFAAINREHNFPPDLPNPAMGVTVLRYMFSHPSHYSIVAEDNGRPVGSNCMDERSIIGGIGPITVAPSAQNHGAGRLLMQAILDRASERGLAGVRLLQAAFHNRSLSLYAKLGFIAREPISVMQGPAINKPLAGYEVRPARKTDLDAASQLCQTVHGFTREGELAEAIAEGSAIVAEREGALTGYSSVLGFFGHTIGLTNQDVQAMISASRKGFAGPGLLVPTRNAELFRWCLEQGLRVMYPMTLMTIGQYDEPAGFYLPSVSY